MSWGKIWGWDFSLMTRFKNQSEFGYWHFTGSQRVSDSHAALAMVQSAPQAAPSEPPNPHMELVRKGKLWDFMEGTAGLWCRGRAKLSVIKPPRHVLIHQMSN